MPTALTMAKAPIERRIRAILADGRRPTLTRRVTIGVLATALLSLISLAVLHPTLAQRSVDRFASGPIVRYPINQSAVLRDGTRVIVTGIGDGGPGAGRWTTPDGRELPSPSFADSETQLASGAEGLWPWRKVPLTPKSNEVIRRYAVMIVGGSSESPALEGVEIKPSSTTVLTDLGGEAPASFVIAASVPRKARNVRLRLGVPENRWFRIASLRPSDLSSGRPFPRGPVKFRRELKKGGMLLTVTHMIPLPQVRLAAVDAEGNTIWTRFVSATTKPVQTLLKESTVDISSMPLAVARQIHLEARDIQWVEFTPPEKGITPQTAVASTTSPYHYTLHYVWFTAVPKAGNETLPLTRNPNRTWKAALSRSLRSGTPSYLDGLRAAAPDYVFRVHYSGSSHLSSDATKTWRNPPVESDPFHLDAHWRVGIALGAQSRFREPGPEIIPGKTEDLVVLELGEAIRSGRVPIRWSTRMAYRDPHNTSLRAESNVFPDEPGLEVLNVGETRIQEVDGLSGRDKPPYGFFALCLR